VTPSASAAVCRPGATAPLAAARDGEPPLCRVLMTVDTLGGVWTHALELAAALRSSGVHITMATMGAPLTTAQRASLAGLFHVTVFERRCKLEWMAEPWEDIAAASDWLLELETNTRPDVIHVNGYVHAALPFRAPTLAVGHSCRCSWFAAVHGCDPPRQWNAYRRQVRRGLSAADLVTAPTVAMLENLRRRYGAFRSAAAVPYGRRAATLRPGVKEPLVLTVCGNWELEYYTELLDRVAARLHWPVYAACAEKRTDTADVNSMEWAWLGSPGEPELAGWYARAAIFALPARFEPFGMAALKAGLAQCALVLGDIPSLREVWGRAALFVPPDDPEALARAINRLATDDALRNQYAARARARAQIYTPERMARGYLALYRALRQVAGLSTR
jgi:glycogen(starch) synthase